MVLKKFQCCDPTLVEIKCPFKGKDLDPKIAFLSPTFGGKKDENGNVFLDKNNLHFRVQNGMAVEGLKTCDCVTYTSKGIFIVTVNFNDKFWATVVATVYKFYCQQIVPSFLMEALPHDNFHTKQLSQKTGRLTNSVNKSPCFKCAPYFMLFGHKLVNAA